MALIKINVEQTVASESAAKKPSYKIAKVGGVQTLVVNSAKKAELQAVLGLLKKAKTAAVSGITASIKSNTASTKARQTAKGPKRTALMETRKTEKTKATADIKQAKALIREANSHAKKHGLGGLNLPLSAADIKTGVGSAAALKQIRSTKLTEFGITGKRGAFKPKFVKEAAFDALGSKTTTKAAAKAPIKKMKGAITGAFTPEKKKAIKAQREKALTGGTRHRTPGQIDDAANKHLAGQSKQWDKDTRMSKRMLKELNGGKPITSAAGWTGTVEKGKGVFTNKRGQKLVVKKSDMAKYGLTPDSFKRALGESNIKDTNW